MTNEQRRIKLSKFLAYSLRHYPERYGLQLRARVARQPCSQQS